ncbi:MAG: hypothetical protein WA797_02950 [Acidimicrobiales bacterium]
MSKPAKKRDYLRAVTIGLRDTHELSNAEIVEYLGPLRDVSGEFGPDQLRSLVQAVADDE